MSAIPNGVILLWLGTNAGIPANFTRETRLDNTFAKGTAAATNPNVTGGNANHTHTSPAHSHTMVDHTHTFSMPSAGNTTRGGDVNAGFSAIIDTHTHTGTSGSISGGSTDSLAITYGSVSNDPPNYQPIFIKSNGRTGLPDGVVALWDQSTIPLNWIACDGQLHTSLPGGNYTPPDLRNLYLKGAATGADAGATGGSYTNIHDISHNHAASSHSHVAATTSGPSGQGSGGGNDNSTNSGHTHSATLDAASTSVTAYSASLTTTETVEPAYTKLMAIMNKNNRLDKPKKIIGIWLGTLANIPRGWVHCDGTNSTIDMRNRHLKIANDSSQIGAVGGSNTHTHAAQSHSHTSSAVHNHTGSADAHSSGSGQSASNSFHVTVGGSAHAINSVSTAQPGWNASTTTADSTNNEPIYRTAAFIQFQKEAGGAGLFNIL